MISLEGLALTPHSFFHEDLEIPWTLGWDLVHQEEIPLPLELVHLSPGGEEFRLMNLSEGLLFQCSSNGLACGVHFLEAISQALLEVIERDSVTCATLAGRAKGQPAPVFRVAKLDSIPFPRVQELLERIRRTGIEILLADNGTDVGIPTWNCYLMDIKEPVSLASTAHGMGSALEQETAMIRAITEAVQGRCVFLSGVRDIVPSKEFRRSLRGDARTSLEIMHRGVEEELDLASLVDAPKATFEEDVHSCLEALQAVGLDRVLVFQLSKKEDPVQTAKVIIPGAEGYIFPYYRPGDRGIRSIQKTLGEGSPLHRKEHFSW
jgi:ribosomal protein S12 methylthiotransferase accessory factor